MVLHQQNGLEPLKPGDQFGEQVFRIKLGSCFKMRSLKQHLDAI